MLGEKLQDAPDDVKTAVAEGCVANALTDKYDVPAGMAEWAAKATGAINASEVVGSLGKKDGITKILEAEETAEADGAEYGGAHGAPFGGKEKRSRADGTPNDGKGRRQKTGEG